MARTTCTHGAGGWGMGGSEGRPVPQGRARRAVRSPHLEGYVNPGGGAPLRRREEGEEGGGRGGRRETREEGENGGGRGGRGEESVGNALTRGCQFSYCFCKFAPMVSRAF